ncbi:MAG: GntR family transcriptional regulator [Verrucomicrobia bacterium]|nr:GntR family transcriptional regulator [Verrucomicrobiota bacterium]
MSPPRTELSVPKYRQVFDTIKGDILSGRYRAGQKLPSETALLKRFQTSRITVGRALRELKLSGLIQTRAGSGSYVATAPAEDSGLMFGLLVPNMADTEIFGPICRGMSEAPGASKHALLWGNLTADPQTKAEQAWQLCQQYINKKVAGLFFAPLERIAESDYANQRVIAAVERVRMPLILLDRCYLPYPNRSRHDLVGIDHRRAGYMVAEHLIRLGCQRIVFLAYTNAASTIGARIAGYREALFVSGMPVEPGLVQMLINADESEIQRMMETLRPDAIIGANDRTAGHAMHTLIRLKYRIPEDVRIVGIDDVEYASLLPVPLTTVHQPCREIGITAVNAMLERINTPEMPTRDILLDCKLVIRDSCGARAGTSATAVNTAS